MKRKTVDSLSDASNSAVIKLPERSFPGVLVQGDSLKIMADLAREIERMIKETENDELQAAAEELSRLLESRVRHYEQVMDDEHLPLPYSPLKTAG